MTDCTSTMQPGLPWCFFFFFFNDTATTEIYTLSLHDALPICALGQSGRGPPGIARIARAIGPTRTDRKSTRLNSSHITISYAVFCLKKKNKQDHSSNFNTDSN